MFRGKLVSKKEPTSFILGVEPKIGFFTPNPWNFSRVGTIINHPFWDSLFLETPI